KSAANGSDDELIILVIGNLRSAGFDNLSDRSARFKNGIAYRPRFGQRQNEFVIFVTYGFYVDRRPEWNSDPVNHRLLHESILRRLALFECFKVDLAVVFLLLLDSHLPQLLFDRDGQEVEDVTGKIETERKGHADRDHRIDNAAAQFVQV